MIKERALMCQQQIQTTIESIFCRQRIVFAQEIAHRAVRIPVSMQSPFAARGNQPVGTQDFKDMFPIGPLAAAAQPLTPKLLQSQLLPQLPKKPARSPLPRAGEDTLAKANLHALHQARR